MKNRTLILAIAFLTIFGNAMGQFCTNDARYTEVPIFALSEITIANNVQYGIAQDFQGNPDTLLLDLYYPNLGLDSSLKRPFILMFHGGGFVSGNKQSGDIRDLCVHLARRGFVCASSNYRLGFDFTEYGQYKARYRAIQDGNAAIRYVAQNANTVRIDTSWMFVGGQSAGALLSLGMVYADPAELDSISLLYNATAVSAELGNLYTSGNNLTNTYAIKGIFNNWGGVAENEVDINEMIPTVAFHGELDTIVLIGADNSFAHYTLDGSRAIHDALTANGICSELTVDTSGGHGIFRNASSEFRAQRASCFFKSVFCNNCANFYTTDSIPPNCSLSLSSPASNDESEIHVFPNPFENTFRIGGIEGLMEVAIYNRLGQWVYEAEGMHGEVHVDLPPGIYFLQVRHIESDRRFNVKLIRN